VAYIRESQQPNGVTDVYQVETKLCGKAVLWHRGGLYLEGVYDAPADFWSDSFKICISCFKKNAYVIRSITSVIRVQTLTKLLVH
jgi:hypothetical protein